MWLLLAVSASVLWGMTYVLNEQVFRHVSVPTTIAIHTLVISIIASLVAWRQGVIAADFNAIVSSRRVAWLFVLSGVTFAVAEFLINFSINAKNATLAALIEISYPLFAVLFAYLAFGESQLNAGTAIGGAFIAIGVCVVYWYSR